MSTWLVILLLTVGTAFVLLISQHGIGMSPDSAAYVGVAENLADGNGLKVPFGETPGQPLLQFPPLYPLTLSFFGWMGVGVRLGSRILNGLLLGGSTYLIWDILRRTVQNQGVTYFGTLLFLISPSLIMVHSMAWSEPLFLFLMVSGILTLGFALSNQKWTYLHLSAFLLGLGSITRYAGIAFILAGTATVLMSVRSGWGEMFKRSGVYFVIGTAPLFLWFIRNLSLTGTLTNRAFRIHLLTIGQIRQFLDTMSGWLFLPSEIPGVLKAAAVLILISAVTWHLSTAILKVGRRKLDDQKSAGASRVYITTLIIFSLTYGLFLVASISFFDANTPLDERILSPLFVSGFLLCAIALSIFIRQSEHRWALRFIVILAAVLLVAFSLRASFLWSLSSFEEGIGFNHLQWRQSQLLASVSDFNEHAIIYTNSPEAMYIHTRRGSYPIPRVLNKVAAEQNARMTDEIALMRARFETEEGYLIYFSTIQSDAWLEAEDLAWAANLELVGIFPDGTIYSNSFRRLPGS
jgi:hypothetical protein